MNLYIYILLDINKYIEGFIKLLQFPALKQITLSAYLSVVNQIDGIV